MIVPAGFPGRCLRGRVSKAPPRRLRIRSVSLVASCRSVLCAVGASLWRGLYFRSVNLFAMGLFVKDPRYFESHSIAQSHPPAPAASVAYRRSIQVSGPCWKWSLGPSGQCTAQLRHVVAASTPRRWTSFYLCAVASINPGTGRKGGVASVRNEWALALVPLWFRVCVCNCGINAVVVDVVRGFRLVRGRSLQVSAVSGTCACGRIWRRIH